MKLRYLLIPTLALFLAACNLSLAADVTPPPNYIPPTPAPTLSLAPSAAPNIESGKAIYAEKCAPCHGDKGMGDGAQGKQLPLPVAAFALPQVGQNASPQDWYATVTRGSIERFMPPFASLTEQQRWDVVAYALTLHVSEADLQKGRELFDAVCADCPASLFQNQEAMASLSDAALAQALKDGTSGFPALGGKMTDGFDQLAAYVRTLSFAAPSPTPEPAAPTATLAAPEATPAATESGTPGVETTPLATETGPTSTPEASAGKVTGSITGANVGELEVTLHGYDHAAASSAPTETVTLTAVTDAQGNYVFEGLDMPEGRIYVTDVKHAGITYNSEMAVVPAAASEAVIPALRVYDVASDYSTLTFDQTHFFFNISDVSMQVIGVYTFTNKSDKAILVPSTTDVPFLKAPANAQDIGYELTQESAPILAAEGGFALPPGDKPFGIVMYYTLPYAKKATVVQPFAQEAASVLALVPEGVKLTSDQLTEGPTQNFQGEDYRQYSGGGVKAGGSLTMTISGTPKKPGSAAAPNSSQNLLVGLGGLGLALIVGGAWMYLRNRGAVDEEPDEDDNGFENEEEILDAIIALDDLRRAGKIKEDAYRERRDELKERLKH